MMKDKITIELTRLELSVLLEHWRTNLSYGPGGTFGDGENFIVFSIAEDDYVNSKKEYTVGKRIQRKLDNAFK
jgi:hypothetical protein